MPDICCPLTVAGCTVLRLSYPPYPPRGTVSGRLPDTPAYTSQDNYIRSVIMHPNTPIYRGSYRLAPHGQPDFIQLGKDSYQVNCKTESVGGNARQRRMQVRTWKRQGLRVTPAYLHWSQCVVEVRHAGK